MTQKTASSLQPNVTVTSTYATSIGLLVLGIMLVAANLRAPITAVGPIIGEIRGTTGISHTMAGFLTTLPLLAFALLSPFAPRLAGKFGTEVTLFAGMVVLTAGIVLRSLPGIASLFAGTALLGLAIAVCNVLVPSLLKREFPHKIGLMTGVYSVSMNLWGAIASGVSMPLTRKLPFGWSGALGCWAILSLIAVVVWLPLLRLKGKQDGPAQPRKSIAGLWRSPLAWKVTFYMGLQSLMFYVIVAWIPEILLEHGLSADYAGWMLSLMQFVLLGVSFVVPLIAARLSSQRGLVAIAAGCFAIGVIGLLSGNMTLAILWFALLGIGGGGSFSLAMMFIVLRSRDAQQSASLSGMAQSAGYLLAAAGPTLFGLLHDTTGGWTFPLLLLVAVSGLLLFFGFSAGRKGYVS
ncbi:CynX/NimT family MFS transporter [Paenibacillus sp. MBLB4367]|uniref:CynX/NimT family MFS transporter n=1 Tax=Paenibacillus sp. MBLB4367 TaxID=3384767 RepID=UPI0039083B18